MGRYILSQFNSSDLPQLVITPSKAIASGLNVPHYSLESVAQSIVRRQGKAIASALSTRRLLQVAVREVIKTKDVEGTAKAFLTTVKDLLRSGIDLTKLQQNSDRRIQQLGNLVLAYQKQLRQRNRIDSAELYWQAAMDATYQKNYLFYGYFAPGKDELAIINAIAGDNSIFVLPSNKLYPQNQLAIEWLQKRGWEIQQTQPNITVGINRLQQCFGQASNLPEGASLNVFPNLEAEVRGVLTQVKVLLTDGVSVKDIVLVTKDEQLYGKTLIDVAWEYDLPIQVDYEILIEQTRIGAWFKILLEVIRDDFPFEATAKLLSHPLANYMSAEVWTLARQIHPQGLTAWQKLGLDLSLLDFRDSSYSRDVWVKRSLDIFSSWDVLEKAKEWAIEIVAYYRIQEALQELTFQQAQQLSKRAFIKEINEILALLTIPAQPGRGGIQLHCPTSLLGTNYPHVFVLGSAEGILPHAIADDPILDFYNRKQLAQQGVSIETAVDIAQRETFYFYCLLGVPTQSIVFSYPEIIDRNPTIPSSYLSRLGLKPSPVTLPIVSIESARRLYVRQPSVTTTSLLIPQIVKAWQVSARRESAIARDLYDGVVGIGIDPQSRTFSASGLTQLGQCPFKWFSARLLKLKELVEAESDLSAAFRGNLYHRCLELSLSQVKTAEDLVKFNREQLAQIFTTAEHELNLTQLPGWEAQRREHLNLLELNLIAPEFLPPEREVVAIETKFTTQWYGLQLRGQVDRIDRTDTGLMVIDYKTSGATPAGIKDNEGKANIDLQLAVYQNAIAEQYPDEAIDTPTYYSLTQQKNIGRRQQKPEELAAFAQQVKSHLERGYYPVSPDVDRKACRYCDYDLVCRKGERLSRKPN